jgi:hypothetical protein
MAFKYSGAALLHTKIQMSINIISQPTKVGPVGKELTHTLEFNFRFQREDLFDG